MWEWGRDWCGVRRSFSGARYGVGETCLPAAGGLPLLRRNARRDLLGQSCFRGASGSCANDVKAAARPPHSKMRCDVSHACCEGVRGLKFSRRYFLKQGGIAMVGLSAMAAVFQRAVAAAAMAHKKQFVVLVQRGAADGLNIVVPLAEP